MSYAEKLKDPRWQKKRLAIFKRDKFTCQKCNDKDTTLNVHHLKYFKSKEPWEINNKYLITLCEHCHWEIKILKDEIENEITFNKIKILKSTGWTDKSRIMFISYAGYCRMRIYDKNSKYIIGYNLGSYDISKIIELMHCTI